MSKYSSKVMVSFVFFTILFFSLMYFIHRTHTVYAENFKAKDFKKINVGTPAHDVLSKLGYPMEIVHVRYDPLTRFDAYETIDSENFQMETFETVSGYFLFHYSKSHDNNSNYRSYDIVISNGIVVAKESLICWD